MVHSLAYASGKYRHTKPNRQRGRTAGKVKPPQKSNREEHLNLNEGNPVTTAIETEDLAGLERLRAARDSIRQQMAGTIVGQEDVVDQLLVCLFARGHCILEGVPGLAKTLMIRTLAECLSLDFNRIQFTPDLMPSDITGTDVMYEDRSSGDRTFKFIRGPIFANVLLADEINRTPPKTQAALLEGMAERQVSVGGERHQLPNPFFVLATQNPIEQEGTYPLPEAQLDRFLMKILVRYPNEAEERSIYRLTSTGTPVAPTPLLSGDEMLALQQIVHKVPVSDYCINYVSNLVRSTRAGDPQSPRFIKEWVQWGVGPRGGQAADRHGPSPRRARRSGGSRCRRHSLDGACRAATPHCSELQRRGTRSNGRNHHSKARRCDSARPGGGRSP